MSGESGIRIPIAIVVAIVLLGSSCAGSSDPSASVAQSEPTPVANAEPTESPTAAAVPDEPQDEPPVPTATTVESAPQPTAEPEPTAVPEPTPVLAAAAPDGPFVCTNLAPGLVVDDPDLAADLEPLLGPGVPGLVAATASSRGLLQIGAAGARSIGGDDALLTTDRMHLGSDTKSMTAALLALLAAESELGLDTAITDVWPDADSGWQDVTLLDLLHHRGGAEDSLGRDQGQLWSQLWQSSIAAHDGTPADRAIAAQAERSRFATVLTSAAPSEEVGQFAYSNSGYMLVGAALEAQFDTPWEELMCEHLFKPLRMDGCGFGAVPAPGPQGHTGQAGALTPAEAGGVGADNPFALGPAGTVHCPVADWARYLSWVLRGARGEDDRLSAETWEVLLQPEGDYAGGWLVAERPWANGTTFSHAGSNTMWFAIAWVAPGIDRAFMVVSNAATPQAQAATDQAIGLLLESQS